MRPSAGQVLSSAAEIRRVSKGGGGISADHQLGQLGVILVLQHSSLGFCGPSIVESGDLSAFL